MHEMGESSYCSKTSTAGFRSFNDKTMNFDGEIVQITPLPPIPPEIVPLPFVGAEETAYVALTDMPVVAPLGAPISSVPRIVPVGAAPSALNSPEKIVTPSA